MPRCEELCASFGEKASPGADPGLEAQFGPLSEVLSGTKEKAEAKRPVHQGMPSLVDRFSYPVVKCVLPRLRSYGTTASNMLNTL